MLELFGLPRNTRDRRSYFSFVYKALEMKREMASYPRNYDTDDLISDLPCNIIENILEFMPIQDAARTSILSTNWRYKWTYIPKLVFDTRFLTRKIRKDNINVVNMINEILLLHDGPIHKFSLCILLIFHISRHDLARWMLFLSRAGVREIFLSMPGIYMKLPSSFFTCQELTYLDLCGTIFEPPRVFRGFKYLTTLILHSVDIVSDVFETLVSSALQLERLTCRYCYGVDHICFQAPNLKYITLCGRFKSISINQSPYLSVASIELGTPDYYIYDRLVSLAEITDHWPRLKKLVIVFYALEIFAAVDLPESFSTRLNHLEHLHFDYTYFQDVDQFSTAFYLIRSSPNLQIVEISMPSFSSAATEEIVNFIKEKDFIDCSLDQLRTVRMEGISGSSPELELLKYLLSSAPVLETMIIEISEIDPEAEVNLTRKLMQFCRISPKAEVIYKDNRKKT